MLKREHFKDIVNRKILFVISINDDQAPLLVLNIEACNVQVNGSMYDKWFAYSLEKRCYCMVYFVKTGPNVVLLFVGDWAASSCSQGSSLGRYVFGSEISYNKAPPRLPGLGC
jgi:hypothetical protein